MSTPQSYEKWRALVEKDLAGKPFDKSLVHEALAGVAVQPLYVEAPALTGRYARPVPFRICMRHETATLAELAADVAGGADTLWLPLAMQDMTSRAELAKATFVLEATEVPSAISAPLAVAVDPLAWRAAGASFASLADDLAKLGKLAASRKGQATVLVSTEPYHDAGADAADEIAIALATAVPYIESLLAAGMSVDEAAAAIGVRAAVGRDTFVELCKLRALRACWTKLLAAWGSSVEQPAYVHAVCSAQTFSVRDPWVNMLRATTQVFAAVTGGADLITPRAFDDAFGQVSPHGRRVARNTGLVLREESMLGLVADPAGGSYYFDSLTDTLAREAWKRFQALSREGIVKELETGALARKLETSWNARLSALAKRKLPVLGVSEFANLGETLPHAAPPAGAGSSSAHRLPSHREAAAFEELRSRADAMKAKPEVILLTLGTFAESRARVGFAANFFSAGGMRTRETSEIEKGVVACLCGTDAVYAEHAAEKARALKAAGVKQVLLAGRPGAIEAALKEAGVDGFVFVGSDVVATLSDTLSAFAEVVS